GGRSVLRCVGKEWTRAGNRSRLPPHMGARAYGGAEHLASMVVETPPAYGRGEPRLLDRVRTAMRTRHMSRRTERRTSFGSGDTSCFATSVTPQRSEPRR